MNEKAKIKTLKTRNKTREEPPEIPKDVYIRNRQKISKTKDKYKRETI